MPHVIPKKKQIGIPKENCTSIVKIFKDNFPALKNLYRSRLPMHNEVDSFQILHQEVLLSSHDNNVAGLNYYDLVFEKFFLNNAVNPNLPAQKNENGVPGDEVEDQVISTKKILKN